MRFDADYRERAKLKDGREVTLRLLRPEDKPRLARGFSRLSPEGRYRRFHTAKAKLTSSELDYLTDVDQQTHFAIGAVAAVGDDDEGEGLGVARFIVDPTDPQVADTAIAVADEAQGVGLGTLLFNRLAEAAVEREVCRFRGKILATNEAMLAITRGLATELQPTVQAGVASVEFELPGAPKTPPADEAEEPEERSLLSLFASGAAAIREFLAWHWPMGDWTEEE